MIGMVQIDPYQVPSDKSLVGSQEDMIVIAVVLYHNALECPIFAVCSIDR